jgi:hypothetical protein
MYNHKAPPKVTSIIGAIQGLFEIVSAKLIKILPE